MDDSLKSSSEESDHEELESVKSSIPANDFDILEDVAAKKTKKLKLDVPKAKVLIFGLSILRIYTQLRQSKKLSHKGVLD